MRFDSYHPFIELLFFLVVILSTAIWNHPVFLGISWLAAFIYSVSLRGKGGVVFGLVLIPLIVAWTALYAYNVHFGITNLGRTFIGNQITLESIVYGGIVGVRVAAILMWLSAMFVIFTTDKVVYLFGRVSPKLALFLAIIFRACPVIGEQGHALEQAQQGVGRGLKQGNVLQRLRALVRQTSMLITWAIEHFADTADSMQSRGSSLRGRSAYSLYRFDNRDRSLVLFMVLLLVILAAGMALDQTHILYSPAIVWNHVTALSYLFYVAYGVFCLIPLAVDIWGERSFERSMEATAAAVPAAAAPAAAPAMSVSAAAVATASVLPFESEA